MANEFYEMNPSDAGFAEWNESINTATGSNYPFADDLVFCALHNKRSDIIEVDKCRDCRKPGK